MTSGEISISKRVCVLSKSMLPPQKTGWQQKPYDTFSVYFFVHICIAIFRSNNTCQSFSESFSSEVSREISNFPTHFSVKTYPYHLSNVQNPLCHPFIPVGISGSLWWLMKQIPESHPHIFPNNQATLKAVMAATELPGKVGEAPRGLGGYVCLKVRGFVNSKMSQPTFIN